MRNDLYEKFWFLINPAKEYIAHPAGIRATPRFTKLHSFKKGEGFKASIPVAMRTAWLVGWGVVFGIWAVGLPVAYQNAWIPATWEMHGHTDKSILSLWLLGLLAVSYIVLREAYPRILIVADKKGVTVGQYAYNWKHAEGLRAGYSAGGVERSEKQWRYIGLRMAYGRWGHDLPYMVNAYYSAAYVVWINHLLETVSINTATQNDTKAGIRQQLF